MENKWVKIEKRISERTGLRTKEEVNAYSHFCMHSDLDNGVIMYGDVQHEFYEDLLRNASEPMKVLEKAYYEAVGNHIHEDLEGNRAGIVLEEDTRKLKSPLSKQAEKEFEKYFWSFILKNLVLNPEKFGNGYSIEYYPKLAGYNYFNDTEFYKVTCGGRGRKLIL